MTHDTNKAEEIEVTEEMIDAGVSALASYHREKFNEEEVVCAIFRAMQMLEPNVKPVGSKRP